MLVYGGKGRVAGHGALSVGKSAHADVFGNAEALALGRLENAYGGIVINGKEGIGSVVPV